MKEPKDMAEEERPWRVSITCRDCGGGQDQMGCFDGGSEEMDEHFATEAEAIAAAEKECNGPPWSYTVFRTTPPGGAK